MNSTIKLNQDKPLKVVVAGAGIVGLTTAIALRSIGAQVTILEQAPEIRAAGSTIALWKNALEVFSQFGIGEKIYSIGKNVEAWFYDAAGNPSRAAEYSSENYSFLLVSRPALTNILADAAGRENIQLNCRAVGFEESANEVIVKLDNGTTLSADLLIGADGVYSQIRNQLLPGSDAKEHIGHEVWRAMIPSNNEPEKGTMFTIGNKRTRGGFSRTHGDDVMWMVNQFNSFASSGSKKEDALIRAEYLNDNGWNDALIELIKATPEDKILYNKIMFVPELSHWTTGRVALIGDAAHALSPHISSGGTLGIEDVKVLLSALTTRPDIDNALKAYEANRLPHYEKVRQLSLDVEHSLDAEDYSKNYAKFTHWMQNEGYQSSTLDKL